MHNESKMFYYFGPLIFSIFSKDHNVLEVACLENDVEFDMFENHDSF